MSNAKLAGQCLCAATKFEIARTEETLSIAFCHCKMCRRWAGGLPLAIYNAKVSLTQSEHLKWWKSSPWGERGFCAACGTSLFWRAPGEENWGVAVGALEDSVDLKLAQHIYIDDCAKFYAFADNAPQKTGAQFVAQIFAILKEKHGEGFLQAAVPQMRAHHGDAFADQVLQLMAK